MNYIKRIDDNLMWFLTSLRYPKRLKTPFSQFLFAIGFNLFIYGSLTIKNFFDGKVDWLTYLLISILLLSIFYNWRLWRQLEREGEQTT